MTINSNKTKVVTTRTGKTMYKVFSEEYFKVIIFMLNDKAAANELAKHEGEDVTVKCFYNFKSDFGNLVSVSVGDEVVYSI